MCRMRFKDVLPSFVVDCMSGVVKTNGKEHQGMFLHSLWQGRPRPQFYPRTSNGMFGEHQQQLVVPMNGLVDALPDLVTRLHVFRSKPAAYAFALQIGIELVGKLLVTAGIANKAGVILNRTVHQGAHVGEEVLGYTGFAQKCFGNVP